MWHRVNKLLFRPCHTKELDLETQAVAIDFFMLRVCVFKKNYIAMLLKLKVKKKKIL